MWLGIETSSLVSSVALMDEHNLIGELTKKKMERVKGIEPSRPAWKAGALPLSYTRKIKNGRSSRIRTCDPLVPSQVRYQTALCPVINYLLIIANPVVDVNHYFC